MVAAAGHLRSAHESARFAHLGAGSQFYWWRLHKKLRVQVTAGKMGRFGDENCHYRFHEHVGVESGGRSGGNGGILGGIEDCSDIDEESPLGREF
uniref:Uncharacterized protein n=1 Tax=Helianthus annuus TaxID=4232 RepID=A0A251VG08_HELAN